MFGRYITSEHGKETYIRFDHSIDNLHFTQTLARIDLQMNKLDTNDKKYLLRLMEKIGQRITM